MNTKNIEQFIEYSLIPLRVNLFSKDICFYSKHNSNLEGDRDRLFFVGDRLDARIEAIVNCFVSLNRDLRNDGKLIGLVLLGVNRFYLFNRTKRYNLSLITLKNIAKALKYRANLSLTKLVLNFINNTNFFIV